MIRRCLFLNNINEIVLFQPNESFSLEVLVNEDTVWLTQNQMIELFQSSKANISEHISNVFADKELKRIQLFGNSEQLVWMGRTTM